MSASDIVWTVLLLYGMTIAGFVYNENEVRAHTVIMKRFEMGLEKCQK